MPIWKIDLAWIADQMGLLPCRTMCECAVGPMEISVAPGFKSKCDQLLLVEPHPLLAAAASNALQMPILHAAVGFKAGTANLIDNNGSSFLQDAIWSPTPAKPDPIFYRVNVIKFDSIDNGEIDVLALDCEGMEWAVLSNMVSEPKLLTIEIWEQNPYRLEIERWIQDRGYTLRFATGPTAETHLYTLC